MEVSAAFLGSDDKNYKLYGDMTENTLQVDATNKRYRLNGMYDGWFYYSDLYTKRILFFGRDYLAVREKEANDFVVPKGYKLFQKFDGDVAVDICNEVNHQLEKAFEWLDVFERKHSV